MDDRWTLRPVQDHKFEHVRGSVWSQDEVAVRILPNLVDRESVNERVRDVVGFRRRGAAPKPEPPPRNRTTKLTRGLAPPPARYASARAPACRRTPIGWPTPAAHDAVESGTIGQVLVTIGKVW